MPFDRSWITKVPSQSTSGFAFFIQFDRTQRARQACGVSFYRASAHWRNIDIANLSVCYMTTILLQNEGPIAHNVVSIVLHAVCAEYTWRSSNVCFRRSRSIPTHTQRRIVLRLRCCYSNTGAMWMTYLSGLPVSISCWIELPVCCRSTSQPGLYQSLCRAELSSLHGVSPPVI